LLCLALSVPFNTRTSLKSRKNGKRREKEEKWEKAGKAGKRVKNGKMMINRYNRWVDGLIDELMGWWGGSMN
jgi:hypothetical protein